MWLLAGPESPFPRRAFGGSIDLVDREDIVRVTYDGTRVAVNEAHARAMGVDPEELLGLPLSEPAPTDRVEEIETLGRVLAEYKDTWEQTRASFTRDGGEHPGRLLVRVRDTGRGIPAEKQQEIFESFVRVRGSVREPGPQGTGLGLTITRRLVELLRGRIDLMSALGEGSEFTVTLPVELPPSEPSPDTTGSPEPLPAMELLLTEDNAINRMFLTMALEEEGHSVTVAKNGKEAVAAARARQERPFDAVLMDVQMPEMDGVEATRAIRNIDDPVARSPVVALTAFALHEDESWFREAGMDGYVTKPVHFPDLWAELRRVTGGAG